MSGFFWAGDVLVNAGYVTHLEKAPVGDGNWYVKVKVHGVNSDGTTYFSLGGTFPSESAADAAMVAIAAGTYSA